MKFKTNISKIIEDDVIIRGERHSELIKRGSFTDAIFLLLSGRSPTAVESTIFEAMLISIIDHGMGTASSLSSRFVMSTGNPMNAAVAAGVLAFGDYHGGAIEKAMQQLLEVDDVEQFVQTCLDNNKIVYGFGHKVYKTEDPRISKLVSVCSKLGYKSEYVEKALKVEYFLDIKKGKKLCLNIDGFIAAILLEMGFSPEVGKGFFIIGRVPGLVTQAMEEKENEKPVRRLNENEIIYGGIKDLRR